jgi:hypothetical protein
MAGREAEAEARVMIPRNRIPKRCIAAGTGEGRAVTRVPALSLTR